MATPYKAVGEGSKDAYNYFHSNVRITIECAFGMLTRRWGILMRPFPTTITIAKVTAIVRCLCRLHNYCINERLARQSAHRTFSPVDSPGEELTVDVAERLASDEMNIVVGEGGMYLEGDGEDYRPEALIGGGHHFDDISYWSRVSRRNGDVVLPREKMHSLIQRQGLKRTTPRHWVGKTPARSYKA